MSYSFNEIEALTKKATRSAGYPWGIAEESAKSVRWLCQHGIDGCMVLATHLENFTLNLQEQAPVILDTNWRATRGYLCPLLTGTALSDRADTIADHGATLHNVQTPYLLLYFCALMARRFDHERRDAPIVCLQWQGSHFTTNGKQMGIKGATDQQAEKIVISTTNKFSPNQNSCYRVTPKDDVLHTLRSMAAKTYAPASEESRLKGAGAGLNDND